jgi:hypothetical protein
VATLYLSAPKARPQVGPYDRDFSTILDNRVGPDYAIYANIAARITRGTHVVVFDRTAGSQAEGTVDRIVRKLGRRVQRYDIYIPDLHQVQYTHPPQVNRCGRGASIIKIRSRQRGARVKPTAGKTFTLC